MSSQTDTSVKIIHGDSLEILRKATSNSVDSIVTDPPYGLSFMGKKWDYDVPSLEVWQECIRVLKPGGYLLAFAGTRTQHRMAVRIEDAGFEIRDMIAWVYGSGFPKSLNIGKAVDKLQGNERKSLGSGNTSCEYLLRGEKCIGHASAGKSQSGDTIHTALTKGNSEWEGWGTALKPALEPITVARKPLAEKTVAENAIKYGTGGINIDGCRVEHNEPEIFTNRTAPKSTGEKMGMFAENGKLASPNVSGRFPANLIHDGSEEVVDLFPNDSQRFFYCAKAGKSERNKGCEEFEDKLMARSSGAQQAEALGQDEYLQNHIGLNRISKVKNNHPTVKPVALMQYLCRLVTPKDGTVLDPFMGSGTTGIGAKLEGFNFIGIEREEDYCKIAEARISSWSK